MPTTMTKSDPRIFRAYDIRGKAYEQVTEEGCRLIGQEFGLILKERYGIDAPKVAVGRDARTHGPVFQNAVMNGLTDAGCLVLDIGLTPSPVNYFAVCAQHLDGSIQVTASHNPKEDNGLKLQWREAKAFCGEDIQDLRRSIESGHSFLMESGHSWPQHSHDESAAPKNGRSPLMNGRSPLMNGRSLVSFNAITPYVEHLTHMFEGVGSGMHVVIDCGNGAAGPTYTQVLKNIGCTVTELYTEPDGEFPNHQPDPSKRDTLTDLQKKVQNVHANIGLAFDGDGDRIGVVDEHGKARTADEVLLLLAQDHIKRHPGTSVVFTVSSSGVLETEIKKWGGKPIMEKVGHAFVEHAMERHGALLGGEQSGHFFCFENYYHYDDALAAGLHLLRILNEKWSEPIPGKSAPIPGRSTTLSPGCGQEWPLSIKKEWPLSRMFEQFPKVYQSPERRPHCPDESKEDVVRKITEHFSKTYPVNTLDGARIDFGSGAWAGIRQGNTSPCLSVCIEARSADRLKEVESMVWGHLRCYPEIGV